MAEVIGQRWHVYDYNSVKNVVLKSGEMVALKATPDFPDNIINVIGDGKRKIAEVYLVWFNKLTAYGDYLTVINTEKLERQSADQSLAVTIASLQIKMDDYEQALGYSTQVMQYLKQLIESKFGEAIGPLLLATEDGDYLVTEDGDFLVAG